MLNLTILTLNTPNIKDFAQARKDLLQSAETDWVLFLDSDETLSPALEKEITLLMAHDALPYQAYSIPRQDTFLGRVLKFGEAGHTSHVRLARRDWGHWIRPVHEKWIGPSPIGQLTNPILHLPHPNLKTFISKIDQYSSIDAEYRHSQGQHSSLFHLACYPIAKFIYNYILRLGFLDGVPGLIHAIFMSFHSYLTWTKLYLLWHKK